MCSVYYCINKISFLSDKKYMRIDLNQLQTKNIEDPAASAAPFKSGSSKSAAKASDAFSVNSNGIRFGHSEDNILSHDKIKKKSVMDQAAETTALGADLQMDQMLVVAQTMSPQDAKKLSEEGYDMSDMDPADAVHSLDRMKIRLAEAGINVAGYTDTVPADKVAEVTGQSVDSAELSAIRKNGSAETEGESGFFPQNTTIADIASALTEYDLPASEDNIDLVKEALYMASELKEITDNTRLFLASEGMEPTIDNVFIAEYSSGRARFGGNAKYVADEAGYVGKAGSVNNELSELKPEEDPDPAFEKQIADIIEQAGYEVVRETKEDAYKLINAGIPLTEDTFRIYEDAGNIDIRPVKREIMDALASGKRAKDAYLISDYKNIKAERMTKEAALSMSADINIKNIDKNITLDTGYLERDVENLKAKEKEAFDLLEKTLSIRSDILDAPAELIADRTVLEIFTGTQPLFIQQTGDNVPERAGADGETGLIGLHERALDYTQKYEKLNQTYEAVGTEVRADLGDSIKKAFANTDFDKILQELKIEHTPMSERAVRIASYSHIDLTAGNVERIHEADDRLSRVLNMLTPARVLGLIRNNVNPLEVSLGELEGKLTEIEDAENRPAEDFARYLVSARNRGDLSNEEAASYIGIYRLVNTINSGDHRAIGALVASGAELSFSNLLSASRTGQKGHIDKYIDESFGSLEKVFSDGNPRIDQMIRAAFSSNREAADREHYEDESRRFAEAAKAEAEIYRALEEADIPRSANNISAYEQLMAENGNKFAKDLYNSISERSKERIKKNSQKTISALGEGDPEKIKESYDEMVKAELIGALEGERLDIRALQSKDRVLSVKGALAKTEEYNIPTEFKGEIININLKLRHGENQNSVDIYFETEDFGSVHAGLRVTDGIRGVINCKRTAGNDFMRERLDSIKESVSRVSGKTTDLKVGNMDIPDDNEAMDGEKAENAMLYRVAKAVLDTVLL